MVSFVFGQLAVFHLCFISWSGEAQTLPAGLSLTNCTYYPKLPLFIAKILISIAAVTLITQPIFTSYFSEPNAYFIAVPFVITMVVSILCILILRGNLTPIKLLTGISLCLIGISIAAFTFVEKKYRLPLALGGVTAAISFLIVRSEQYYQVALFWRRMMNRQRATGLTRAEDIAIHLELEEGTKEGFENAKQIVTQARERIIKTDIDRS